MATISVRGFVSKPEVVEGPKGKFSKFTLSEGVKKKDGKYENFFYNVTNFKSSEAPEDGARASVENGWLKLRYYETGGVKKTSLDITITSEAEVTFQGSTNGPSKVKPAADVGENSDDGVPW